MDKNPWMASHIDAEAVFQGGDGRSKRTAWNVANAVVRNEYAEGDPPVECPHCAKTAWYKATIGAHKCPDCGGLCDSHGDPY